MFDLNSDEKETIFNDEEFHSAIDQFLGNLGEVLSDKDIDPEYFSTPWAHIDIKF